MRSFYDESEDRWSLVLSSQERWGAEPATPLLIRALGGPSDEVRVRLGGTVVELSVEDGRLARVTVEKASTLLQDDVLFDAVPLDTPGPEEGPPPGGDAG